MIQQPPVKYVLDPRFPLTNTQLATMKEMVDSLNTNYKIKHESEDRDFNFLVQPYHIPIIQRMFAGWRWQNVIKGRQVYMTTLITLMMMDLCARRPYFYCLVKNSTKPDSVQTLAEKFDYVIEHSEWLKQHVKGHKSLREVVRFKNGANIAVGQTGRSATKNFTLITEASISAEKDPRGYEEIFTGATHGGQHYYIIQETSPYGYNNKFIRGVRKSRELEQHGKLTRKHFINHFAGWWRKWSNREWDPQTIEMYTPIPPEFEEYFSGVEMAEDITLDINQRVWYIITQESRCEGNPLRMKQEHPSTLDEALQTFSSTYILRESMDVAEGDKRIGEFRVSSSAPCAVFWDFGAGRAHTAFAVMQLDHLFQPNHYKWVHSFSEAGATPLPVWFSRVNSKRLNIMHHFLPHDAGYNNLVAKKLTGKDGVTIYDAFMRAGIRNVSVLPKVQNKRAGFEASNRFAYECVFCRPAATDFIEALYGATRKYDEKTEAALDELDPANQHSHLYDCFELASLASEGHHLGMLDFSPRESLADGKRLFDGTYC